VQCLCEDWSINSKALIPEIPERKNVKIVYSKGFFGTQGASFGSERIQIQSSVYYLWFLKVLVYNDRSRTTVSCSLLVRVKLEGAIKLLNVRIEKKHCDSEFFV
jgi:hypothetical protein